ncbi:DNA polymerase family B-domain-containing protein [Gongronella butleri]|nr:DNA polymerase family B-domain-containing protein [Gongronella butleri]
MRLMRTTTKTTTTTAGLLRTTMTAAILTAARPKKCILTSMKATTKLPANASAKMARISRASRSRSPKRLLSVTSSFSAPFSKKQIQKKPSAPAKPAVEDDDFMKDLLSTLPSTMAGKASGAGPRRAAAVPAPTRRVAPPVARGKRVKFELDDLDDEPLAAPATVATNSNTRPGTSTSTSMSTEIAPVLDELDQFEDTGFDMDDMDMDDVAPMSAKADVNDKPAAVVKIKEEPRDPSLQLWEESEAQMMGSTIDESAVKEEAQAPPADKNIVEANGDLHFWWYDAYEHRDKGAVYLFGKVCNKATNQYVSCCVIVQNIQRNVFVLPRTRVLDADGNETTEEVEIGDVYEELDAICTKNKIKKWASKPTTRKYAFELAGVPPEAEYMKVVYGYNEPALSETLSGRTFGRVFGTQTGPLEHFLIKRDIMGPCWLQIKNGKVNSNKESWCKTEFTVTDPKQCSPLRDARGNERQDVPPLEIMSISLRTILNKQKNANEIIAVSAMVCKNVKIDEPTPIESQTKVRFTALRQLSGVPFPPGFQNAVAKERAKSHGAIQLERTEASMLNYLLARIQSADPDVIVGHNFNGFDLDVLLHRMKALNTQNWHRLGRLKRRMWPKLQAGAGGARESTYQERMIMSGRLICDTYLAAKDLIRSKSYRLTDLARLQLKIDREDIEFDKMAQYYNDTESLMHMVRHCSFDTFLSSALMFKLQILPLTKQLTNLAGNLWSRTMTGARAERNEFLLLHEFHREKYICPDKSFNFKSRAAVEAVEIDGEDDMDKPAKNKGRRKPAYSGGLVLEPKKGFYDKYVLLLDFNSLYPSIIQEYNICFTTVHRPPADQPAPDQEEQVPDIPDDTSAPGVLPRLLKTLVERRRQVKNIMKDPKLSQAEMMQLDIRQKGLKLTANSMYGCLGFSHSRFYAKPLAMLITHKGREILQNTVDLAGSLDLNVIYGDTDSIMVYTNELDMAKVKEMGNLLKKRVNEHYKLLEIDIDGFFKHMLLLKKKKYAALLVEEKPSGELVETVETKGLDLVRRDWCDLSHDISTQVLSYILSNMERDDVIEHIHQYLRDVQVQIRNGEMLLSKFVINKQLTRKPEEYADAKSQPHVQVALRMRENGQPVNAGDTIPYVICLADGAAAGASKGFAERARDPSDVKTGQQQLDIEWYLYQQVHPPISRLISPIEGTSPAYIAECLGLDGSRFSHGRSNATADDGYATLDSQISDAERFKHCDRLHLRCRRCQALNEYDGIGRLNANEQMDYGLQCKQCQQIIPAISVRAQVVLAIRAAIQRYYQGWLVCDDDTCANRTRMMSVFGRRCLNKDCHGTMTREYTDKELYTQLMYYAHAFDTDLVKKKYNQTPHSIQITSFINKHQASLTLIKKAVDVYLDRSAYRHVDLQTLIR